MLKALTIILAFGATTVDAKEIWGRIEEVDGSGVVHIEGEQKVMLWGLDANSVAKLAEFLTGRWIRCNQLTFDDGTSLGDCGLSPNFSPAMNSAVYLHLATWLPAFDMAVPSCSVGGFEERFIFSRPVLGDLHYGCRNGVPSTGMMVVEFQNKLH